MSNTLTEGGAKGRAGDKIFSGMTLFAGVLSLLYFIAVGVSMLNDRRKGRGKPVYEGLSDDETSSLDDYDTDSITPGERIEAVAPVAGAEPIERRYDDMT